MSATATIADIARQAGVGTATVDRVLNRRPGVNAETVQRVMQVVAELGAPPQRGRPRKGENFRFAFVLPAEASPFNELVDRQIAQAAGEFRHQHITEVTHRIDSSDADAVRRRAGATGRLRWRGGDGARPAAGEAGHQRAGAHRRARGHAVLRRGRLDARNARRRRQPRRGAHGGAAARPHGGHRRARHLAAELAGDAPVGRDRPAHRLRAGARGALPEAARCSARPTCRPTMPARCRALLRFLRSEGIDPTRVAGIYNVGSGSAGVARARREPRADRQRRPWSRTT